MTTQGNIASPFGEEQIEVRNENYIMTTNTNNTVAANTTAKVVSMAKRGQILDTLSIDEFGAFKAMAPAQQNEFLLSRSTRTVNVTDKLKVTAKNNWGKVVALAAVLDAFPKEFADNDEAVMTYKKTIVNVRKALMDLAGEREPKTPEEKAKVLAKKMMVEQFKKASKIEGHRGQMTPELKTKWAAFYTANKDMALEKATKVVNAKIAAKQMKKDGKK
jgi:hypothetical protein